MRNTFGAEFYKAASEDERLCLVIADIFPAGALDKFKIEHPRRFVNTGVAEQIMIGICAGMAAKGLRPFALSIATFALYRPFEFIRNDLAYQNLPVTVVGVGGGVTYSTLGGTHHAMEDVAIACAVPNMRVIAPCDPLETAEATRWCTANNGGPVYLRLGKAGEAVLNAKQPWEFGKLRTLRPGARACIIGYGPILGLAMDAAESLKAMGEEIAVISAHTLKPLDRAGIAQMLQSFERVVVLEEMVPHGGLAAAVKCIAYDIGSECFVQTLSLKDEFIHRYGSHDDLREAHGLTFANLVEALSWAGNSISSQGIRNPRSRAA